MNMQCRIQSSLEISLLTVVGLLLSAGPVAADTSEGTLEVRAVVGDQCTVTSASLDFGSGYDGSIVNATGSIDINCVTETELTVELDGGLHATTGGTRAMVNGESQLFYNLYSDSSRSNPWDSGITVGATISGSGSVPVYGSIPAQGNGHTAGVHTDSVTITLAF
jgi:spore coat protein U-like protein